jgi:hypothetical protein
LSDFADWRTSDVDAAEKEILEAIPQARTERGDYGFGLVAFIPQKAGFIVFRPARPSRGDKPEDAVREDVGAVIDCLRAVVEDREP